MCDIYNVGTGKPTSIKEVASIIIAKISPQAKVIFGRESWKGDIKTLGPADITRLKNLGFSPKYGLEEGIESFLNWYDDKNS
jgi:nucleoside-diphosphate-sugar epimerase